MPHHPHVGAAAPGLAAPVAAHNDEAPGLAGAEGFRDQDREGSRDCDTGGVKRTAWAALRARAELAGLRAELIDDGAALVLIRWGMSRTFTDPAAAGRWLDRDGGAAA